MSTTPVDSLAAFVETLEAITGPIGTLTLRADGHLASPAPAPALEAARAALYLPVLTDVEGAEIELGRVLGEGGMGVVREAFQQSLGRTVAVKAIGRALAGTAESVFFREARITGRLEHPNIVPVHVLGSAPGGAPLMVMKKIEGRLWSDLLAETRSAPDHVERHLDVLLAVMNAVEFAHSRGVLHRDLKPDNVMVGAFGEVVVVDWGLAVALGDPPVPDLPRAADVRSVDGTPHYMAPEMVIGDGGSLGPHTDTYLLGAILHEILVGRPRHDGSNLTVLLYNAFASAPVAFPPEVPSELAVIANRATHKDPASRFPDVPALRAALLDHRRHATSRLLASESEQRWKAADREGISPEARGRALVECRFGFQQALALWADNAPARAGLGRTLERMAEDALARRDLEGAALLLDELEQANDALVGRVEELRAEIGRRAARVAALEEMARAQDLSPTRRALRRWGVGFGAAFGLLNALLGALHLTGALRLSPLQYVGVTGTVGAVTFASAVPRLGEILPNRAGRRLALALTAILGAEAVVMVVLGWLGLGLERALAVSLFQLAGSILVKTATLDPRMNWSGVWIIAFAALALFVPPLAYFAVGASYATFFISGALFRWEDEAPRG